VLSYERLRNMAVLINAVAFFTAVALGTRTGALATRSYITNTHRQPVGKIEGMTKE
jgi:hypothetical protein